MWVSKSAPQSSTTWDYHESPIANRNRHVTQILQSVPTYDRFGVWGLFLLAMANDRVRSDRSTYVGWEEKSPESVAQQVNVGCYCDDTETGCATGIRIVTQVVLSPSFHHDDVITKLGLHERRQYGLIYGGGLKRESGVLERPLRDVNALSPHESSA